MEYDVVPDLIHPDLYQSILSGLCGPLTPAMTALIAHIEYLTDQLEGRNHAIYEFVLREGPRTSQMHYPEFYAMAQEHAKELGLRVKAITDALPPSMVRMENGDVVPIPTDRPTIRNRNQRAAYQARKGR